MSGRPEGLHYSLKCALIAFVTSGLRKSRNTAADANDASGATRGAGNRIESAEIRRRSRTCGMPQTGRDRCGFPRRRSCFGRHVSASDKVALGACPHYSDTLLALEDLNLTTKGAVDNEDLNRVTAGSDLGAVPV